MRGKFLICAGLLLSAAALLVFPVFAGVGNAICGGIVAFLALLTLCLPS